MANTLDRRAAVKSLLSNRGDMLVLTGLGGTCWDAAAAGDDPLTFYLWGAMGGAAMVGLGLALAQPGQPVVVVTGDGEMLMGIGGFATIAQLLPPNLTIVVLDNGSYGETGGQPSHTAGPTDLAAIARACGIPTTATLTTLEEVDRLTARLGRSDAGTSVSVIKIDPADAPRVLPSRDGAMVKSRLRAALGLESM